MISKIIGSIPLIGLCAGVYWWNSSADAQNLASCLKMVAKYEEIYLRQPPDRHVDTPALKASWAKARGLCQDQRPVLAWDVVYRAASTCRFNNGCSDVPVNVTVRQ